MGIRNSESLVKSEFSVDSDGHPTGGFSWLKLSDGELRKEDPEPFDRLQIGVGFMVDWQDGIVENGDQNGAFVEDILEAARQRLQFFNTTEFRCRENSIAITKIEEALQWLDWRTRQRVLDDVENTYEAHTPAVD